MSVKNTLSFLIDIIPFIGGGKMCIEVIAKKDMTGMELKGGVRVFHTILALGSLALDATTGVGGSAARVGVKFFSKGFLKRGAVMAAKTAGRGSTRNAFRGAARTITRMEKTFVGRRIIDKAENGMRIRIENNLRRPKRDRDPDNIQNNIDPRYNSR